MKNTNIKDIGKIIVGSGLLALSIWGYVSLGLPGIGMSVLGIIAVILLTDGLY